MKILFSALGTTDPVRGLRDGGMLHIARHYRPDKVLLFISREMQSKDAADNRYSLAFDSLYNVTGYRPEIERIALPDIDPSEYDAFDLIFREYIRRESAADPKAQLLLNLSSGTPQMKNAWMLIAVEKRWKTVAIQVKSPEGQSNQADGSTRKDYDALAEIELNEDNMPGSPDRCTEPHFFALRRSINNHQIAALMERYDYEAAELLFNMSSADESEARENDALIRTLLAYARARQNLQGSAVRKYESQLPPELRVLASRPAAPFDALYEFQLLLRNLVNSGNYSEYALRMNPFIVELEKLFLEVLLGVKRADYLDASMQQLRCDKLQASHPALYQTVQNSLGRILHDENISQYILVKMIEACTRAPEWRSEYYDALTFFMLCSRFNQDKRNPIAHQFKAVDGADFEAVFGKIQPIDMSEKILTMLCAQLTPQSFTTYNPYTRVNGAVLKLLD